MRKFANYFEKIGGSTYLGWLPSSGHCHLSTRVETQGWAQGIRWVKRQPRALHLSPLPPVPGPWPVWVWGRKYWRGSATGRFNVFHPFACRAGDQSHTQALLATLSPAFREPWSCLVTDPCILRCPELTGTLSFLWTPLWWQPSCPAQRLGLLLGCLPGAYLTPQALQLLAMHDHQDTWVLSRFCLSSSPGTGTLP